MFYKDKAIAVIGSEGYIGKNLCSELISLGSRVIPYSKHNSILNSIDFWDYFFKEKIDLIFYLAASESRDPIINQDLDVNALGILYCLEKAKTLKIKPSIIYTSTSNIAGLVKSLPVNESTLDNPQTIFAIHKLLAENYLNYYRKNFFIPSISLRLSNIYGPSKDKNLSSRVVINKMILKALSSNKITLYKNKDKARDFLFINDAIESILYAGEYCNKADSRFYVIGSGEETTYQFIADKLIKLNKKFKNESLSIELNQSKLMEVEMRDFLADSNLFKSLTGWEVKYNFEDGLEKTFTHFANQ